MAEENKRNNRQNNPPRPPQAQPKSAKKIRVVATQMGIYNNRRYRAGEVFDIAEKTGLDSKRKKVTFTAEQQFSKKWMERYDPKKVTDNVPKGKQGSPGPSKDVI